MKQTHSVIVAGAGLAGLTAGLRLQKEGKDVLIIEQNQKAGGLCRSSYIDGYEFATACNDFGSGFGKILQMLEVPVKFLPARQVFCVGNLLLNPASARGLFRLLPYAPDLLRAIYSIRKNRYANLEELIDHNLKSSGFKDLIAVLSYALAMAPGDVLLQALRENFSNRYNYGYEKAIVPVGGPGAITEAMVKTFTDRGGKIIYNTRVLKTERNGRQKEVYTTDGTWQADNVISSVPRWHLYPENCKQLLHINMLYVALSKRLVFPKEINTFTIMPAGVKNWLGTLDQGILPEAFGFHIVRSLLSEKEDYYTVNIYFMGPRGYTHFDEGTQQHMIEYIFGSIEERIPGFGNAVLYKKFVSPDTFRSLYGISSQHSRYVLPEGFEKPPVYDPEEDIYYIGNSVYPPGEHVGGAVVSAWLATSMILERDKV